MAKGIFRRYLWLVRVVRAARNGITYEEINEKWKRSSLNETGDDLAKRTFRNWVASLPEELDVEVSCEHKAPYKYYISNDDLENNDLMKWALEVFSVGSMVSENKSIRNRIMLEDIPTANDILDTITTAMRNNHKIWMRYHRFGKEPKEHTASPYAVKLCQNRWYLVAHSDKHNSEYVCGLDRIEEIHELEETFDLPEDYSPKKKFENCIGIDFDEKYRLETVRLKISGFLCDYFHTLPLHHTQEVVEETKEYTIFSYQLRVNYELISKLMGYGSNCEVMAPKSLRKKMREALSKASELYND